MNRESLRRENEAIHSQIASGTSSPELFVRAAFAAQASDDHAQAMTQLDSIDLSESPVKSFVGLIRAELLFAEGKWRDCEKELSNIEKDISKGERFYALKTSLFRMQGRDDEALQVAKEWIRSGVIDSGILAVLSSDQMPLNAQKRISQIVHRYPEDPIVRLAEASDLLRSSQFLEAKAILDQVTLFTDPPQQAWIDLALCFLKLDQVELAESTLSNIDQRCATWPDYWCVVGKAHDKKMEREQSVAAFLSALEINSRHRDSLRELCRILADEKASAKERQSAQAFQKRLELLDAIEWHVDAMKRRFASKKSLATLGQHFLEAGDVELSGAWNHALETVNAESTKAAGRNSASQAETPSRTPLPKLDSGFSALAGLNRGDYPTLPLPASKASETKNPSQIVNEGAFSYRLQFEDVSQAVGVNFQFNNGDDESVRGMKIYQTYGGGCAILDFDMDGWPDIYFPQAGGVPGTSKGHLPNRLFQNQEGKSFSEKTLSGGIDNRSYGQGAAAGDLNQDGFQDLYIANIGPNTLWINQGDGTFSYLGLGEIGQEDAWTTSAVIADINGDSLPDIVDANYVDPAEAIARDCVDRYGAISCNPWDFGGSKNTYYLSNGLGSFDKLPDEWNINNLKGRSLGILVSNFDDRHGNEVFIANDAGPNHLLVSYPDTSDPGRLRLKEEAVLRGCSVDANGKPQACMGIASGDFDHNGKLDMYVTNFINEYNTVYLQKSRGLFSDRSRSFGTVETLRDTVGFGSQAHDFDADGFLDLMVVNGHVDNYLDNIPFLMPPDLWKGETDRFVRSDRSTLGSFFQRKTLGRALAIFDFNRDQRMDFVATHVGSPAAIVENLSETKGHRIWFRLVGTRSDRDAVGARIDISASVQGSEDSKDNATKQWMDMVTKGSGYMASNEPIMHFGIGECPVVDKVEVRWPNGTTQSFGPLKADSRYLLIEGNEEAIQE